MKHPIHPRISGTSARVATAQLLASTVAVVIGCIVDGHLTAAVAGRAVLMSLLALASLFCFDILEFAGHGKGTAVLGFVATLAIPVSILAYLWHSGTKYWVATVEQSLPIWVAAVSAAFVYLVWTQSPDESPR